jgi:UDPglucose 6-dehydrogenase
MTQAALGAETVGVIGAGYVGLVAGACFSALGFDVSVVEVDRKKIEQLRSGKSTIYEPGLSDLIRDSIEASRLRFYNSCAELFKTKSPDVIFIAVGTPENSDGTCNLDYVMQAVRDVVTATTKDVVLVVKSTVPVGTSRKIKDFVASLKPKFRIPVVNNPEFLKEGSAVADFMRPERVVLGGSDGWALEHVKNLYESFLHNGHPLFVVDHESAELAKLASNLMLATRISLINQVSRLAAATGADIKNVQSIMRADSRIGSKYLYAGMGYGGSCFPKDVKNFINQCESFGIDSRVAKAVDEFNDSQKLFFVSDIKRRFTKPESTTIAVLGTAFKPDTDDIRESPALDLIAELDRSGYSVRVYDPRALEQFRQWADQRRLARVRICSSVAETLESAQALVLATEWQEFQRLSPEKLKTMFAGNVVYDGKNILRGQKFRSAGYEYLGVGC